MRRSVTVLMVLVVVVGMAGAVPMTGVAQSTSETATPTDGGEANETDGNATDGNATAPGDLLEGVVGVQEAELEGEIENRAFGIRVANASTPAEKAQVIAEQHERNERRVAELQERKQELKAARENGTISESEYRSEITQIAVESRNVERLANGTANVTQALEERGINVSTLGINTTAIARLANNASALTGPEVAEIARSIAGPSVAVEASDGASERRGPPEDGPGASAAGASQGGNQTASGGAPGETPEDGSGADAGSDAADSGSDNAGDGSGGSGGSDGRP